MNAAGMSPWRLFRPFLAVTHRRSRCWSPSISAYVAPEGPARCCGAGRPRCAPTSSPTSCSPAASPSIERGLTLPHPRAPAERPAARHLHRRPARSEGARDHPRRTGRDREERARHFLCSRTAASSGTRSKQARSDIVQFDRYAFDLSQLRRAAPQVSKLFGARALSLGTAPARPRRSAVQAISRGSSAPSCMTGSSRRSIRSRFVLIAFAFLGAPRTTRQSRAMSLVSARSRWCGAAPDRLRRHDRRACTSPSLLAFRISR